MTNNFTPAKAGQQRNRLSKEEYAEKMKAEKEAVYQMADDTAKAIVSDPEKFKAFLDTQSRLDRYSAVNALLIFKQLPEASQLKNFDDWSKDNVKIQKGAKSISILEPVEYAKRDGTTGISYNVKKVFDVSQTNGKRPPAPTVNRDPKALITVMLDSSPVEVEATNELPYPNMAAFYNNEEQTLYVKRDVGDSVAVAQCVAQELGHAQLSINSDSYSRADTGKDRDDYIESARRKAHDLKEYIDVLFDWFKLNSNEFALEIQSVEAAELTRNILIDWIPIFEDKQVDYDIDIPEQPVRVKLDMDSYMRIINNLIQNVIAHSHADKIKIALSKQGNHMELLLADNGVGIEKEDLKHIFERLYKCDKGRSEKGSGLGLSIVHQLVEKMGGNITVESVPGKGTKFMLLFPLEI